MKDKVACEPESRGKHIPLLLYLNTLEDDDLILSPCLLIHEMLKLFKRKFKRNLLRRNIFI